MNLPKQFWFCIWLFFTYNIVKTDASTSNTYVAQPHVKLNVPPPFNYNGIANNLANLTSVNSTSIQSSIKNTSTPSPIYIMISIFGLFGFIGLLTLVSLLSFIITRMCKCNRKISNDEML
jgi:hypothetical protein